MLRDLFSLFPAYAGVIPLESADGDVRGSFPRTRGGDPIFALLDEDSDLFSPHTRG